MGIRFVSLAIVVGFFLCIKKTEVSGLRLRRGFDLYG